MKCKNCNLVEMRVSKNNGQEVEWICPSCGRTDTENIENL